MKRSRHCKLAASEACVHSFCVKGTMLSKMSANNRKSENITFYCYKEAEHIYTFEPEVISLKPINTLPEYLPGL